MHPFLIRAALFLLTLKLAICCDAQQPMINQTQRTGTISVMLNNVRLKDVLHTIFLQTSNHYKIDPTVPLDVLMQTVSMNLRNVNLSTVLDLLLSSVEGARLTYRIDRSTYVFQATKVTLELDEEDPAIALAEIFRYLSLIGTNNGYMFCPKLLGTKKIRFVCHAMTPEQAIRDFIAHLRPPYPLRLVRFGKIYVLQPQGLAQQGLKNISDYKVTAYLNYVNRRDAIKAVFTSVGLNYMLSIPPLNAVTIDQPTISYKPLLVDLLLKSQPVPYISIQQQCICRISGYIHSDGRCHGSSWTALA